MGVKQHEMEPAERQTQLKQSAVEPEPAPERDTRQGLRGMGYSDARAALSPVQMKGAGGTDNVHALAQAGTSGGGGPLPHAERIQSSFGHHDISGVRAHTDAAATTATRQMGAEGFTRGSDVGLASSGASLHTVAHEAAHAVQQRSGVQLRGGVGQPGDSYEQNADAVADRVVRGESAQGLLDQVASPGGGGKSVGRAVQGKGLWDYLFGSDEDNSPPVTAKAVKGATKGAAKSTKPARTTTYTINSGKAWVRDPSDKTKTKVSLTITSSSAYLRKPDKKSSYLTKEDVGGSLPEGTILKNGKVTIPKGTMVTVVQATSDTKGIVKVRFGQTECWTSSGNYKSSKVRIPNKTEVKLVKTEGTGKSKLALVEWNGEQVWTWYGNLKVDAWDMTYATTFGSPDKKGKERSSSKTTQVRFNQDGGITLAKVKKKNANKRDASDLSKYLPDILTYGTPCVVLESKGKCLRVIDYAGKWDGDATPPGWWTRASNLSTWQGTVDLDKVTHAKVKTLLSGMQPKHSAADTHIGTKEMAASGQRVVKVSSKAKTYDEAGKYLGGAIPKGPRYALLSTKELPGTKVKSLSKIMGFDGTACWVPSWAVSSSYKDRGYALEKKDGKLWLVMTMNQGETENDRYEITEAAAKALQASFLQSVDAMIGRHKYTPKQKDLLKLAKQFAQSGKLQSTPGLEELNIPSWAIKDSNAAVDDGITLNGDLQKRMKTYYKFLQHSQIIAGPVGSVGGIRATTVAHELSTKWTLNPKSGLLSNRAKRLEFGRRLLKLNGGKDVSGITWCGATRTADLKKAIATIDNPPKVEAKDGETPKDPVEEARKLVDTIVGEVQANVKSVGNGRGQGAQAAEGYPKGDSRRLPNTNDGMGISNHCGGEAIDVTFPFVFNYYDPIIDAVAAYFGLHRPVKDSSRSPEHWHYERLGIGLGPRAGGEEPTLGGK